MVDITCLELEKFHLTLDESGSKSQANSVASLDNVVVQSMDVYSDHTLNSVSDNQTADLQKCRAHVNKVDQFNYDLGFVTQTSTQIIAFNSTPLDMTDHKAYLSLVSEILASGLPNYHSVRVPLPSVFNWDYLQQHIGSYHDGRLLDYLKFGFPLGLASREWISNNDVDNHASANEHKEVH